MAAFSIIRLMPVLIFGFFVLEIASIILVGQYFGLFATILLIIADIVLGVSVIRTAGVNAFNQVRMPFRSLGFEAQLARGVAFRVIAGVLFIIPGFVSDVLAVLALAPPVQNWLGRRLKSFSSAKYTAWENQTQTGFSRSPITIEGEIVEISEQDGPPPAAGQDTRDNRN